MACLPVPLAEELLFRGVLYTWLRRWGVAVAVAASSLTFGLLHGLGVTFFTTTVVGVICAFAYERSGSLWTAVVAHAMTNTTLSVAGLVGEMLQI